MTAREKNFKQSSEVLSKNTEIDDSIKEASRNRSYDDWSLAVLGRLEGISDLHAADAIYHHACYSNFKTNKNLPQKYQQILEAGSKRGRPKNVVLENIYEEICNYMKGLEENDELITVPLLNAKMSELCVEKGRNPYDKKYLKKRITEDFDGSIVTANIYGNADVISFRSTASKVLQDFHKKQHSDDSEVEKYRIIKAAADIIKNDIKELENNTANYPTANEIENAKSDGTKTLDYFLENLISCKSSKPATPSLAQAIIQSVRPRSIITPLQFSLAITLHRHFGSRYLIDLLNEFGFCLSYSEVLRFESCAANQLGTSLHDFGTDSFLHFIGDNVDHNADTIDGLNTFHGMGIIACVNNPRKCHRPPIKQIVASSNDVVESSKIEMKYFNFSIDIKALKFFNEIDCKLPVDSTKILGNLW